LVVEMSDRSDTGRLDFSQPLPPIPSLGHDEKAMDDPFS